MINGSNISNASNIEASKILNIVSLSNGGLGISNINNGEILMGFDNTKIRSSSNLKWDEPTKTLIITSNIFCSNIYSCNFIGNGANISNLDFNKFIGILPFSKGGLGFSNIDQYNIIYASESNRLSNSADLKWNSVLNTLIVQGNINIGENNYIGNGFGIKNLNTNNLIGIVPVAQGGTGITAFDNGKILLGGPTSIVSSTNLIWNEIAKQLGIGKTPTTNLDVAGGIKCDRLEVGSTVITAQSGIANVIDASAITTGILGSRYGGTGVSNLIQNQILIGNDINPVIQTSNLTWDNTNIRLGIGTAIPIRNLDIRGDINYTGNLYFSNNLIPSIVNIKQSSDNSNIIYTDKQLFIGFSNNDNYKFKVDGNIYVGGYITGLSDIRYKTNISNINNSIEKVEQLQGVYYNLINEEKRSIGLIAQEVEKIIPEVVYTNIDNTKSIAYGNMIGLIVESIKELSMRIKRLEEKL